MSPGIAYRGLPTKVWEEPKAPEVGCFHRVQVIASPRLRRSSAANRPPLIYIL